MEQKASSNQTLQELLQRYASIMNPQPAEVVRAVRDRCIRILAKIVHDPQMSDSRTLFRVAVVGHRGYAGQVLHALLMHHPCIDPVVVDARAPAPDALADHGELHAAMLAIPGDAATTWVAALRERKIPVVDLSDAHRRQHGVHYGLPELTGSPPKDCSVIANPGCYPTASLLALRPLVQHGVVEPHGIAIVGQSGTSGAGKSLRDDLHFSELHGNLFPYKVGEHRHIPEIEHHLGAPVCFVTELVPLVRGLLVTAFVRPASATAGQLADALRATYEPHPYIEVLDKPDAGLGVRHVVGSHSAIVGVGPRTQSGLVPVFCAIDNLMRGAASQAVHNLNLWLGLPAFAGLPPALTHPTNRVPGMTRQLQ